MRLALSQSFPHQQQWWKYHQPAAHTIQTPNVHTCLLIAQVLGNLKMNMGRSGRHEHKAGAANLSVTTKQGQPCTGGFIGALARTLLIFWWHPKIPKEWNSLLLQSA